MRHGFQRAGKQLTKFELDCIVIKEYLQSDEMSKAMDYCIKQGINEKTFVNIAMKVKKEKNRAVYFAVIATYKDGSKSVCKGNRSVTFVDEDSIDKEMLYKSFSAAMKGKNAYEKSICFNETYQIKQVIKSLKII